MTIACTVTENDILIWNEYETIFMKFKNVPVSGIVLKTCRSNETLNFYIHFPTLHRAFNSSKNHLKNLWIKVKLTADLCTVPLSSLIQSVPMKFTFPFQLILKNTLLRTGYTLNDKNFYQVFHVFLAIINIACLEFMKRY